MRTAVWNALLVAGLASAALAGTFGTVVPIGGHASDIGFDPRRQVVYVSNFTANRIEVLSTPGNRLQTPIYVRPQPASLALSPDSRYLLVTHYGDPGAITILDLDGHVRQTLALPSPPLSVAFGAGPQALLVTTQEFFLVDPVTGRLQLLEVGALTATDLPVPLGKFPPEILRASTGVSGDGQTIYVLADAEKNAVVLRYRVVNQDLRAVGIVSVPPLGPRVISVNRDATNILAGWGLINERFVLLAQFPYPTGRFNIGSHAIDDSRGVVYAQIPVDPPPASGEPPVLHILDSDNLTVRERLQLKENLAGRSILSPDLQTLYAVSDSGVMILPVGSLAQTPRVAAVQEQLVFRGNACDRRVLTQEIDIVDPGRGQTAFSLSLPSSTRGIRLFPDAGVTPGRVRIEVDPTAFQDQKGTVAVSLEIRSAAAVNLPPAVRLLINTRDPDQRGLLHAVAGKIVDILADPVRNRVYLLRQDRNQVLVMEAADFTLRATLRTGNTPTQMAMTADRRHLIVANDNSHLASVFDLETLRASQFIEFPPGNYPRSIAVARGAILAAARSTSPPHQLHRIDFNARRATALPSLGVYENRVSAETALASSPSGSSIFIVQPDGNVLLYESDADTFVASRKDFTALAGAYAAVTDELFLVENNLLNRSLVPIGRLAAGGGTTAGFAFLGGFGLRATSTSAAGPGVVERIDLERFDPLRPTRTLESPVLAQTLRGAPVGQIGQAILPFTRPLTSRPNPETIFLLSTSGITVLPTDFDAAVAAPVVETLVNLADESPAVAPGGLISVGGSDLSPVTTASRDFPIPTSLGEVCATVNNLPLPLLRVSPRQMVAQLPFEVLGDARLVIRSPGGVSTPFAFPVLPQAPAVFRSGTAGPDTGLATVVRVSNNELVTLSNPIHPEEMIVIYATGLGRTSPDLPAGFPAPFDPVAAVTETPVVTLGGRALDVRSAGLVPFEVGIYEIRVFVPWPVPEGMEVPLTITQGNSSTTLSVRVVGP